MDTLYKSIILKVNNYQAGELGRSLLFLEEGGKLSQTKTDK